MHQVFKHENRFAQLYDQAYLSDLLNNTSSKITDDIDQKQQMFESKLQEMNLTPAIFEKIMKGRTGGTDMNMFNNTTSSNVDDIKQRQID